MSYIGKSPAVGNFVKLDAISTSSTNTYNLTLDSVAFTPESANHMLVSLNGVIQAPLSSFSVSGSTITFLPSSGTLSSSDSIDFIMVYGNVLDIGTPSDSTVTNAKTNFVSTSSAAGLQIKGDGTTDGTLQLNCSQNSHGIKLASPAHSASQSYKLIFPSGNVTAGKFLKVDSVSGSGTTGIGTMTFADAGGGDFVKLGETGAVSAVDKIELNGFFSSTYKTYKIYGQNCYGSSGGAQWQFQYNTGGSYTALTSGYYYINDGGTRTSSSQSYNNNNDWNTTRGRLGWNGGGSSSYPCMFEMTIDNPAGSTRKNAIAQMGGWDNSSQIFTMQGFNHNNTTTAITGIRFLTNSGTMYADNIAIFGLKY